MPRRRHGKSVRSIRSTINSPSDPRYYRLLGSHNHNKNLRRMMGMAVNELMKRGELSVGDLVNVKGDAVERRTVYSGKGATEFGRRLEQLKRDAEVAEKKLYEDPLDENERPGISRLLAARIAPVVRKKNVYIEYEREGATTTRRLDEEILRIKTPYDLYDVSKAIQEVIEHDKKEGRSIKWLEDVNSDLLRIASTAFIQRDFQAFGWKDSADSIFQEVQRATPLPLDPTYFSDNLDTIRRRVERKLAHNHRSNRHMEEQRRIHQATLLRGPLRETPSGPTRTGGPLTRLMKLLSPFEMPRAKRKEIYGEFSHAVIERREQRDVKSSKRPVSVVARYKGVVRYHAGKAFKAARLSLREKLTRIGMNPDDVLNRLDLLNGSPSKTYETSMMKRLNVLSGVIREKKTPIEAREAILDIIMRYQGTKIPKSAGASAPLSSSVRPAAPVPNPLKRIKREERRHRQRELDEATRTIRPTPGPAREALPESFPQMVEYLNKTPIVTHEAVISLKKMVKNVRTTTDNRPLMKAAIRHLLLAERATFGLHGRLEERALRNRALPQNKYEEFRGVMDGLMREGIFAYEQHGNRNDFIALKGENRTAILSKYGHKKNQ